MTSFFYYGRLSSAQLDRWQALTQRPVIDHRPVGQTAYWREIKDNGYKSVFTNSWLVIILSSYIAFYLRTSQSAHYFLMIGKQSYV